MSIVNTLSLESNRQIKINFDGGDLSSDAGLLLLKEFAAKIGFTKLIKSKFKTNDTSVRFHKDNENLMQMIYQIISAYFEDDCSDELTLDPVFNAILEKNGLASQPTLSRFFNRMGEDTLMQFDDIDKKIALKHLFVNSNIMLIYGAAGTGKTTLINYISRMFGNARKLYLTKTHTALQNVIRSLDKNIDNCDFEIIDSITRSNSAVIHDIVFIDECSTIDNRTMELLLGKISNDALIVMSGDIYQIESIDFGNWFFYAKDIVKAKGASIELSSTWRTEKEELKGLWKAVREKSTIVTEMLSMEGPFSENLGENIFHLDEDEVVLCLNYDGKFGLNNMNQYFQNANTNSKAFSWEEWSYKIGDRIIFTNTRRSTLLYNNLKGTIINISYAKKA